MVINRCSHLNIDCLNLTDFIVKGLEYFLFNDFCVLVAQSCLTLCSSMDFSLPGSSVHGILQAGILEWVAIPFSGGIFPIQGLSSDFLHCRLILHCLSHQGRPKWFLKAGYSGHRYCIFRIRPNEVSSCVLVECIILTMWRRGQQNAA